MYLGSVILRDSKAACSERGAAAVEFALVAMLLILLLVGSLQFGLIFNRWLMAEHAAREGVRWASLRNPAGVVRTQAIAASPGLDLGAGDVSVSPGDPTAALPGTPATVIVRTTVPIFVPIVDGFLGENPGGFPLTASATQRIE